MSTQNQQGGLKSGAMTAAGMKSLAAATAGTAEISSTGSSENGVGTLLKAASPGAPPRTPVAAFLTPSETFQAVR